MHPSSFCDIVAFGLPKSEQTERERYATSQHAQKPKDGFACMALSQERKHAASPNAMMYRARKGESRKKKEDRKEIKETKKEKR